MRYVLAGCAAFGLFLGVACGSGGGPKTSTVAAPATASSTQVLRNADDARWKDAIKPGQPGKLTDTITITLTNVRPLSADYSASAHVHIENLGTTDSTPFAINLVCDATATDIGGIGFDPIPGRTYKDFDERFTLFPDQAVPKSCVSPMLVAKPDGYGQPQIFFQIPKS